MAFFCKSYENVFFWVFLHAEFISALKTETKSMDFEKHGRKDIYHHYFLFFVDFLYKSQAKMSNTN